MIPSTPKKIIDKNFMRYKNIGKGVETSTGGKKNRKHLSVSMIMTKTLSCDCGFRRRDIYVSSEKHNREREEH